MEENSKEKKVFPIYVISGGKGIAGHTMVHSLIIQYPEYKLPVHIIPEVQTEKRIREVVRKVSNAGGLLTHTMVNSELRRMLKGVCKEEGVKEIDFMGELADYLEQELGVRSVNVPGLYRRINAQYFQRIEAIEYTLNHDDGMNAQRLKEAEIVLVGVSRSGKIPLSVYMSMFGWKVANVPLIKGIPPPEELFQVDSRRAFGLSISPGNLISQRLKRLQQMNNLSNEIYTDDLKVREEIRNANLVFQKGKFSVINVNNKPIETTANEILALIYDRFEPDERKLKPIDE